MDLSSLPQFIQRRIQSLALDAGADQNLGGTRVDAGPEQRAGDGGRPSHPVNVRDGDKGSGDHSDRPQGGLQIPSLRTGLVVLDGFVAEGSLQVVASEMAAAMGEQQRHAGMGGASGSTTRAASTWHDTSMRGDFMRWLHVDDERNAGRLALAGAMDAMLALRPQLAAMGYDVAGRATFQAAVYPGGGARYARHADASESAPGRAVTAVLYLNAAGWDPVDGGHLAVYNTPHVHADGDTAAAAAAAAAAAGGGIGAATPAAGDTSPSHSPPDVAVLVAPLGGRLVVFESSVEHEVLACHAPRSALTAWFYKAPLQRDATGAAGGSDSGSTVPFPPVSIAVRAPPPPGGAASGHAGDPTAPSATVSTATSAEADEEASTGTIFVSIASYRDPETRWMVWDLFKKAAHPGRVHVGVVWQVEPGEEESELTTAVGTTRGVAPEWLSRVREVRLPASQADGPVWARHLAQRLVRGEDFFLQLDAHTRFVDAWDVACVRELQAAEGAQADADLRARACSGDAASASSSSSKSRSSTATATTHTSIGVGIGVRPKVVLSTYPPDYSGFGACAATPDPAHAPLPLLCASHFDDAEAGGDGLLRFTARALAARPSQPLPSPFWAAGFSFSRGCLVSEVPYPDSLPHLFFGEEVYMLARMWTRGWRVWAPSRPLVFHQWERSSRAHTFQGDGRRNYATKRVSEQKVLAVLGAAPWPEHTGPGGAPEGGHTGGGWGVASDCPPPCGWRPGEMWGLGSECSLEEFERHVGVSFIARTLSHRALWGGLTERAFDAQ